MYLAVYLSIYLCDLSLYIYRERRSLLSETSDRHSRSAASSNPALWEERMRVRFELTRDWVVVVVSLSLSLYIYIYIYIYMCVYIHTYIHTYTYM